MGGNKRPYGRAAALLVSFYIAVLLFGPQQAQKGEGFFKDLYCSVGFFSGASCDIDYSKISMIMEETAPPAPSVLSEQVSVKEEQTQVTNVQNIHPVTVVYKPEPVYEFVGNTDFYTPSTVPKEAEEWTPLVLFYKQVDKIYDLLGDRVDDAVDDLEDELGEAFTTLSLTLTGALYDNSNSAGLSGNVLVSTGSGVAWTATSSLGIVGGGGSSQWTTAGSDIYYTGGSVGIGTSTPQYRLTVTEDGVIPEVSAVINGSGSTISIQGDGSAYFMARDVTNDIEGVFGTSINGSIFFGSMTDHALQLRTGNTTRLIIASTTGDVGVAITPTAKLHVLNTSSRPSFLVEDSSAPDTTPFVIDDSGNVGIGTAVPTHALTLTSGKVGAFYNTADQVTNYERVTMGYSSNVFTIRAQEGGTGTSRALRLTSNIGSFTVGTASTNGVFQFGHTSATTNGIGILSNGTESHSSGVYTVMSLANTITQSGTAGYTMLLINPAETTIGSGVRKLIDAQVGGASRFVVQSDGNVGVGTSTPSHALTVAGNQLTTGYLSVAGGVPANTTAGDITASRLFLGTSAAITTNVVAPLQVVGNSAATSQILSARYSSDTFPPGFQAAKARGSIGAPAPVVIGDALYSLTGYGYVSSGVFAQGSFIIALADKAPTATAVPTALTFNVASSTTPLEAMRISSSRYVGIGTTIPSAKLQITNSDSVASLLVEDTSSTDSTPFIIDENGNMGVGISTVTRGKVEIIQAANTISSGLAIVNSGISGSARIWVNTAGAAIIDNGTALGHILLNPTNLGNVGIGTTTPSQEFTVAGDLRLTGAIYDSNNSAGTSGYVLQSTAAGQRWVATSTLGFAATANFDTSAELLAILTDETGTGNLVFSASPTFTGTVNAAAGTFSSTLTAPYFNASGASTTLLSFTSSPFLVASSTRGTFALGFGAEIYSTSTENALFLGNWAGFGTDNVSYSNFIGYSSGDAATDARYSNFIGYFAGNEATNASTSNFIGRFAGYEATNAAFSNFLGYNAGNFAPDAQHSNFFGEDSGRSTLDTPYSNFMGRYAGFDADSASYSNFFGLDAGRIADGAFQSNFLGASAGYAATDSYNSNFFGWESGINASSSDSSNFLGQGAGRNAAHSYGSNFIGEQAGDGASYANSSNFIGAGAGRDADGADNSTFIGLAAGRDAVDAAFSFFGGESAGYSANNASNAIFLGTRAGYNDTVNNTGNSASTSIAIGSYSGTGGFSNSIAFGQGVLNSASRQLNIGNVLYATGIYNSNTPSATALSGGNIGIGTSTPSEKLSIVGSGADVTTLLQNTTSTGYSEYKAFNNLGTRYVSMGVMGSAASTYGALSANESYLYNDNADLNIVADSAGGTSNIVFATGASAAETMRLTGAGRLGIGTSTPDAKLEVVGNGSSLALELNNTSTGDGLRINTANATANNGLLWYQGTDNLFNVFSNSSNEGFMALYDAGVAAVQLASNGNSYFNGGNVGIGTTTPLGKVQIVTTSDTTPTSFTSWGAQHFVVGAQGNTGGVGISYNQTGNYGIIGAVSPGVTTRTLAINPAGGTVGIGTTTPEAKLHIHSSLNQHKLYISGYGSSLGNGIVFRPANNTAATLVFLNSSGVTVGSVATDAVSTTYNTTSDKRVKTDIEGTSLGLSTLMDLPVRDFVYTQDPEGRLTTGFIAQELYEVFPWAVTTNGDTGTEPLSSDVNPWSVDYGRVTPLLAKSIQDLNLDLQALLIGNPSTSSTFAFLLEEEDTIWNRLATIAQGFVDGVLTLAGVTTDELCLRDEQGSTCIDREELEALIDGANAQSSSNANTDTEEEEDTEEETQDETSSSTPEVTEVVTIGDTETDLDGEEEVIDDEPEDTQEQTEVVEEAEEDLESIE